MSTPRLAVVPTVELVPIENLTPLAENPRQHGPRDLGYLEEVLQRVGAARSGVVDEHGVVLAGNGFRQAAMQAGFRQAIIVDADGQTPVFVRRRGLTASQKDELIVADNQAAALSGWDLEVLQAYADRHPDVRRGWTEQEWAAVVAGDGPVEPTAGLTDPDDVPVPRATDIQAGDLFALGPHVILCGNSTRGADVARLLGEVVPFLTDPPYGVDYDPAWRAEAGVNKNLKKLGKVANDDRADWTEAWRLFPGTVAYVWHAGLKASIVQASLEGVGFAMRAQIVWAKDRLVLSRGDYHWQHEPCWYAVRAGGVGHRTDDRSQTTLWEIPSRDDTGHGHGTQKPVECMRRPIANHGGPDDHVYEPFSGSGTTIIAAEQLGRRCFAMEITPIYVQMAIDRWENFAGRKAVKVGEAVRA